jgi:Predicted membrane protein
MQVARHRAIVRWAFPIWLYVSVTGVLIYLMLYHWFAPAQ